MHSTLKVVHAILPERIFFILPANLTILSTLGVGLLAIASIISDQVSPCATPALFKRYSLSIHVRLTHRALQLNKDNACRIVGGLLDYVANTANNSSCTM